MRIDESELLKYRKIWFEFDPDGCFYMKVSRMPELIKRLLEENSVLITKKDREYLQDDEVEIEEFIADLQIPVYHTFQDFHYWDVLNALVKAMFRNDFTERQEERTGEGFNDFDDLLDDMFAKAQTSRITMCELMRKEMRKNYYKVRSKVDRNMEGDAYDSRVVIFVPRLIPKIREFLRRLRAKRLAHL